jgi:hypothetical protein
MAKEKDLNDRRKYDNGDIIRYKWEGEELQASVYAVRFQQDKDGILHSYQYIVDSGKRECPTCGDIADSEDNFRKHMNFGHKTPGIEPIIVWNVLDSTFIIGKK